MRKNQLTTVVVALALLAGMSRPVLADASDDHRCPVLMRVGFKDGSSKAVLLIAQSPFANADPDPEMHFATGTGEIVLYSDMIISITEIQTSARTHETTALVKTDTAKPRRLTMSFFQPDMVVENRDGTREIIDLRKVGSLTAIRKVQAAAPKAAAPAQTVGDHQ